jgi:energy-coupling factor transporter ATP-binding protein EcfA2
MADNNLGELIQNSRFTVLLGKNGSGKSTFLRQLSNLYVSNSTYISPERGGSLKYDPGVDNNISSNDNWLRDTRNQNRFESFRQQSAAQFRNLEVLILREIEKDRTLNTSFELILESINEILPAIKIVRGDKGFLIFSKNLEAAIPEDKLSSGESELISLVIEILVFSRQSSANKLLILDEPDVHLHPDLQQKLISFLEKIAIEKNFKVVIATHSTAIIGSFSKNASLQIIPVENNKQSIFQSFNKNTIGEQLIPIFGSHPLSNQFNSIPILLVEGEDDQRVFEQINRSSNGKFKFLPTPTDGVHQMNQWEKWLDQFLPCIYDSPIAFSIRDLDDSDTDVIEDYGIVKRSKLNCYSIENLLLTTEVIHSQGFTEDSFKKTLIEWHKHNPNRQDSSDVEFLINDFSNRQKLNIKKLRNLILTLLQNNKPWEVVVGREITKSCPEFNYTINQANTIANYLGAKTIRNLFS